MARPPLGLGRHGSIRVTREGGQWVARCRFRQLNGVTVRVERWASSKTAATHNLQDELRNRAGERTTMLSASSRFADAVEIYLVKIADRREDSAYDLYRYWMDTVVLPALGQLRIHECDVAGSIRTSPPSSIADMRRTPDGPYGPSCPGRCSRPYCTGPRQATRSAS